MKEEEAIEDWMNIVESQDGWGYLLCCLENHENREQRTQRHNQAKRLVEGALEKRKHFLGEEDLNIAQSYQHLGYFCQNVNNWGEAERYYRKSLEIRKALLPEVDPLLAESYNNLGLSQFNFMLYEEARVSEESKHLLLEESKQLLNHALEIYRKMSGYKHYNVALISLHLADVYMKLDCSEAKRLCHIALKIGESISEQYLRVEASSQLARLYLSEKDYKEAKFHCDQGLALAREYKKTKVESLEYLTKRIDDAQRQE